MKNLIFKCNWNFDPERDKYLLEEYCRFALLSYCFEEEQREQVESLLDVHKGTSIQISILVGDDA